MKEFSHTSLKKMEEDIKACERQVPSQPFSIINMMTESVRRYISGRLINKKLITKPEEPDWVPTIPEAESTWIQWDTTRLLDTLYSLLSVAIQDDLHGTLKTAGMLKEIPGYKEGFNLPESSTDSANDILWNAMDETIRDNVSIEARNETVLREKAMEGIHTQIKNLFNTTPFGRGVWKVWTLNPPADYAWDTIYVQGIAMLQKSAEQARGSEIFFDRPEKKKIVNPQGTDSSSNPAGGRHKRKANQGSESLRPPANRGNPSAGIRLCYKCNKKHRHEDCLFGLSLSVEHPTYGKWAPHPDINTNPAIMWPESEPGLKWKTLMPNMTSLPPRKTLSKGPYKAHSQVPGENTPPKPRSKYECKLQCNNCNTIMHTLADSSWQYTPMYINSKTNPDIPPHRLNVLLDSGSLGEGGNFISPKTAEILREYGYTSKLVDRTVCSCFDQCITKAHEIFKLKLSFKDTLTEGTKSLQIECMVINTAHDVIIGYETIKLNNAIRDELITQLKQDNSKEIITPATNDTDRKSDECREGSLKGTSYPDQTSIPRKQSKTMREVHRRRQVNSKEIDNHTNGIGTLGGNPTELLEIAGPAELQHHIVEIYNKIRRVFSELLNKDPAKMTPMVLGLVKDAVWETSANQQPPRIQSRLKAEEILLQCEKMLKSGIIRASKAPAYSQVMLTPKPNNQWRFCIDYRRLNIISQPNKFPLPKIKDMLHRLGSKKAKYYAVIDLTKGYYQAPLAEISKILTAFITPHGLYEWNRVAMGLTGAPGYFQRAMATEVLYGLLYERCELYLDDIIIFGKDEKEFLENLEMVLRRLDDHNITVNPKKCRIGLSEVEYVGHTINQNGIHFSREKLQKVIEIDRPVAEKQLKSFVGFANYFRDHVRNHSTRIEPLTRLLDDYNPKTVLQWNPTAIAAFEDIKKAINECPMLFFMDETSPVHLYTDASEKGIGGYLCQIVEGKEHPIAFYSKSLTREEKKWGIPCLEGYAIHQAFRHFEYLLRDAHTNVHTDHKNLIYLKDPRDSKMMRWKLELQEFSTTLAYVKGVDNPIADFWSRNDAAEEDDYVIDRPYKVVNMLNSINVETAQSRGCCPDDSDFVYTNGHGYSMYSVTHNSTTQCEECNNVLSLNNLGTWKRFVIPNNEYEEINKVHNEVAGHHGVEETLTMLAKKQKKWKYMREHVRRFIHECGFCQKNSYEGYPVQIPRYISGRYQPMERLAIDTIHTPGDESGNEYIVAIIDCFSRFLTLTPIPVLAKEQVAKALLKHMGTFGAPAEVCSDKGGDYVNDIIQELLNLVGTEHVISMAYSKEENSIVERSNKETWKWIRAVLYDKRVGRKNTTQAAPFAERIHNAKTVKSLGYSPGRIIFGDRVSLDRNILLPPENREEPDTTMTEWMIKHRDLQDTVVQKARELQEKQDRQNRVNRTKLDGGKPNTEYKVGDYVLLAYPPTDYGDRRPNKKHVMHRGPYQVESVDGLSYTLQNIVSKKTEKPVSVFRLRPFHYDAARTNPHTIALTDHEHEFFVEKIMGHTGKWSRKHQMTFTVRWEGYDETWDSEETFTTLQWNDTFRDYVTEQGKERMLPEDED